MSDIEQRHEEIKAKIAELNTQTNNMRMEMSEYNETKLPQVKKKIQDLSEQIGPAKNGYESKASLKKTEELQTLSKSYNSCIDQRNLLDKEKNTLDSELAKLNNEIMSWTREVEVATTRKNTAEDNFQKKKAERVSYEKKLEDAKQVLETLKTNFKQCHDLKKEFLEFKFQPNEAISSLVERMRDLSKRMVSLGFDLSNDEIINKIMGILPNAFENFKYYYNRDYGNRNVPVEDFYTMLFQEIRRINYK